MPCMHLECSILTIPRYFTGECHIMLIGCLISVDWLKLFGDLLIELCKRHVAQAAFKSSCTVGINTVMVSSFNRLLLLMACLHLCMAQWMQTGMTCFSFQLLVSLTSFYFYANFFPCRNVFSLYGDPAYPQSIYIFGGYNNPLNGSTHVLWNTSMSKVCEVVEWGLANILSQWSFLNFRAGMKIFQIPVAKYNIVGAFLVNVQTYFMVIKPWITLTVRLCHFINTCH